MRRPLAVAGFLLLATIGICTCRTTPAGAMSADALSSVVFYAHTNASSAAPGGKVLNTIRPLETQHSANASRENTFQLQPLLGSNLRISGTVIFRIWLRAESQTMANLALSLIESNSTNSIVVTRIDTAVGLDYKIRDYNFAIASVRHTFTRNSAIELRLAVMPANPNLSVFLYWNSPNTPTQLALPCVEHVSVNVRTFEPDGSETNIFKGNTTERYCANISVLVNVTDPIGTYDLSNFSLSLLDSQENLVLKNKPLGPASLGSTLYSATFKILINATVGTYSIVVSGSDLSGNIHIGSAKFFVANFYWLDCDVVDGQNRVMEHANVTVTRKLGAGQTGVTDSSGRIRFLLPSSEVVGDYAITVVWKGTKMPVVATFALLHHTEIVLKCPVHDYSLTLTLYSFPLRNADISLLQDSKHVASGRTNAYGLMTFTQMPEGNYTLEVRYYFFERKIDFVLGESKHETISITLPYQEYIPVGILAAIVVAALPLLARRGRKLHPTSFKYFEELAGGGIPPSTTTMIYGDSGSGKTALLEHILHENLEKGGRSVYVTNVGFPSAIRRNMEALGKQVESFEGKGQLLFIDSYSGIAGKTSTEKHSTNSPTDLTGLGVEISTCLKELKDSPDIFLDSVSPLLTMLKPEYILNFLQSVGARVKGSGGRFYFTAGTSVDTQVLAEMQEVCDCVIETQVFEVRGQQRRRMRIKKMRGRKHSERWTDMRIEPKKGLVFLTRRSREE